MRARWAFVAGLALCVIGALLVSSSGNAKSSKLLILIAVVILGGGGFLTFGLPGYLIGLAPVALTKMLSESNPRTASTVFLIAGAAFLICCYIINKSPQKYHPEEPSHNTAASSAKTSANTVRDWDYYRYVKPLDVIGYNVEKEIRDKLKVGDRVTVRPKYIGDDYYYEEVYVGDVFLGNYPKDDENKLWEKVLYIIGFNEENGHLYATVAVYDEE